MLNATINNIMAAMIIFYVIQRQGPLKAELEIQLRLQAVSNSLATRNNIMMITLAKRMMMMMMTRIIQFAFSILLPPQSRPLRPATGITANPHNSVKFEAVLRTIKRHLIHSDTTISHYLRVCEEYNLQLDLQRRVSLTLGEIREAFLLDFPTFGPLPLNADPNDTGSVHWGVTVKRLDVPRRIYINSDLLQAFENLEDDDVSCN
jgi:hypothetical protein